jgi:hypothetical protein
MSLHKGIVPAINYIFAAEKPMLFMEHDIAAVAILFWNKYPPFTNYVYYGLIMIKLK